MNKINNNYELYVNGKYWYTTETNLGRLYVGIDRNSANQLSDDQQLPELIKKALILSKSDTLICYVEEWLGNGLVLKPATIIPNSDYIFTIQSKNNQNDSGPNSIILSMQEIELEKIPEPTIEILSSIEIKTCYVPVNFVLSEFFIEKKQYDQIEHGRILLIPDSYDTEWRIKLLRNKNNNTYRTGILKRDARTLVISDLVSDEIIYCKNYTHIDQQNDNLRNITITLRYTIPISLDRLHGWAGKNSFLLDYSLRHYQADIRCDKDIIATGNIISVANGYGIDINE